MDKNIEKIINDIVWWIPFKNRRNHLRNELIKLFNDYDNKIHDIKNEKNAIEEIIIQKEGELYKVIDKVIDLTNEINNLSKQKKILKENLRRIEIETHSYCNRQCWFCPNSVIDRHSQNIELDENLYLKIIDNLKEIDYSYEINFHRFNEPLANKELILKRIKQARTNLPKIQIGILTNSDYLTKDYLDELKIAGVNFVLMSYYFNKNENYNKDEIVNIKMKKLIDKLGLSIIHILDSNDGNRVDVVLNYDGMSVMYKASDFTKMGNTRGGVVKGVHSVENRLFRCFFPFSDMYVDYNGNFMPCCNLRSDVESHKDFIIGNIKDSTLFELFTNKKISDIRKYLVYNSTKHSPCNECYYESEDKLKNIL
ncbi:radical SAM/SPASM domain-containing protein [Brachyspira pilosicoli]|uniref:radical SAM/SPASM domain-containing protein n=1 Tax=Brachyspira pilosicoli TaxID=52584 RepID=UPI0012F51D11|nr:radical SAM/SPASM domain-containing protein [Brachyspira pilosicoli]